MKKTIARQFAALGFRKRIWGVFTRELSDEVLGWVGLNYSSKHTLPGHVEMHPVIGVRHQDKERLVAELQEEKFHSYVPPTASNPLDYLISQRGRYRSWPFQRAVEDEVATADMVGAVERYGLPYMDALVSREALSTALAGPGNSIEELRILRQAALALLMERRMRLVASRMGASLKSAPEPTPPLITFAASHGTFCVAFRRDSQQGQFSSS